jgi:hypothetical protein
MEQISGFNVYSRCQNNDYTSFNGNYYIIVMGGSVFKYLKKALTNCSYVTYSLVEAEHLNLSLQYTDMRIHHLMNDKFRVNDSHSIINISRRWYFSGLWGTLLWVLSAIPAMKRVAYCPPVVV